MRNWLREIRTEKQYTFSEMADFLNIPLTTYRSYEFGERNPTVEQAKKLSEKLKVEWTIFFK